MSIFRKFFTVSGLTAISRLFGTAREALLSHFLGANAEMDAYLIAFKFPVFFRRVFSEGGFQSVFVPYITDFLATEKIQGAKYFASRVFSIIFWSMLAFTIAITVFAKEFVILMAPGFASSTEKLAITISFTRIIFPSMIFVALSSVYTSILMSKQKFFSFSIHPIITNIVLILFIAVGENTCSAGLRMSYGILTASIVQFFYLYWCIKKMHLPSPRISKVRMSGKIAAMLKNLFPVLAGASVIQINVFVSSLFGSFLATGSITYIYIADRIIQLPLALFGISMATILLPEISIAISKSSECDINKATNNAMTSAIRLTLPFVVWLTTLAYLIVSILYGHGKFVEESVQKTANVLICFAVSIPVHVASRIFSSIYFAQKDSKTPMLASIYSIIGNIVLCCVLIFPLQEIGIAAASSFSSLINIYILLKDSKGSVSIDKEFLTNLAKFFTSAAAMLLFITIIKKYVIINHSNVFYELLFLGVVCSASLLVYVVFLFFLKDSGVRKMAKVIKQKFC